MSPVHHELDRVPVSTLQPDSYVIWDYRKWRVIDQLGDDSHREVVLQDSDGKYVTVSFGGRGMMSLTTPPRLSLRCTDCDDEFDLKDEAYIHQLESNHTSYQLINKD